MRNKTNSNDKRMEANKEVKRKLAYALTELINEKAFSDISISELVERAKVARASYYRNFDTKEQVLINITDEIMETYHKQAEQFDDPFCYESILMIFSYFKQYKNFILSVYKAGLAYIYLDMFDRHIEELVGDMPYNDAGRYMIYYRSGALYNVFLKWLEADMAEPPELIARMICDTEASRTK